MAVILSDDPAAVLNLLHPSGERPGDGRSDLRHVELLSMEHVQALYSGFGSFRNMTKSERTVVEQACPLRASSPLLPRCTRRRRLHRHHLLPGQVLCSQARVVVLNAYSDFSAHIAKIAAAEARGAARSRGALQRIEYFRELSKGGAVGSISVAGVGGGSTGASTKLRGGGTGATLADRRGGGLEAAADDRGGGAVGSYSGGVRAVVQRAAAATAEPGGTTPAVGSVTHQAASRARAGVAAKRAEAAAKKRKPAPPMMAQAAGTSQRERTPPGSLDVVA